MIFFQIFQIFTGVTRWRLRNWPGTGVNPVAIQNLTGHRESTRWQLKNWPGTGINPVAIQNLTRHRELTPWQLKNWPVTRVNPVAIQNLTGHRESTHFNRVQPRQMLKIDRAPGMDEFSPGSTRWVKIPPGSNPVGENPTGYQPGRGCEAGVYLWHPKRISFHLFLEYSLLLLLLFYTK